MKILWRTLSLLLTILLIMTVHIFVVNFLPYPFNHLNITFSWLLLLLTIRGDKKVIWLGLIVSYFLDLFSSIPFGIGVATTIITLLLVSWFQLNILTNRSGYMVFPSLLFGLTLYRALFVIFLTINNYFTHQQGLYYKEIVIDAAWEISLSSLILFLLYLASSKLFTRLNRGYIINR